MNESQDHRAEARPAPPRRRIVDGSFFFIVAFAALSAIGCWVVNGADAFRRALADELALMAAIAPVIAGAILLASFLQVLTSTELVRRWLGRDAGWRGMAIAAAIGMLLPGGPMVSFPLMLAVINAGADIAASIAFLTSWAALGLHRVIVWELPFMGSEFALIRFLASLPLPFVAGWIAGRFLRGRVAPPAGGA